MIYKPINNRILIKPDGDLTSALSIIGDRRWVVSVTGTVLAVSPVRMDGGFLQECRKKFKNSYHPELLNKMRHAVKSTVEQFPGIIYPGDRVFFSYLVQNKPDVDGNILCHYDSLVCKTDPIVPLNGYVLVKMDEYNYEWMKDVNKYGEATVMHIGGCTEYREGGYDEPDISVGDKVLFEKKSCVPLEVDVFNTLTEGQSSLFRVRRKNILCFQKNEGCTTN